MFHIYLQGWEGVPVCLIYHWILHHLPSWTLGKHLVINYACKICCLCFYKVATVPKCLCGSKTKIVYSCPSSLLPHSERRDGWLVLFRKGIGYSYCLLPSTIFLSLEENRNHHRFLHLFAWSRLFWFCYKLPRTFTFSSQKTFLSSYLPPKTPFSS